MMLTAPAACVFAILTALASLPQAPPQGVTVEWLKSLKSTSNDPSGDAFIGSRDQLSQSIDAMVRDSSLLSPMYLFMASKTALTLDRLEDAAFLFYAAQLRATFDFDRYDVARQPDGNNAATYLGFLRETIGMSVNPAIMREPARFAAVIDRLDRWELVPSRQAFYPDFESAKGFKMPAETWAKSAAAIKDRFMTQFGRRYARLLNDREYFDAFRFMQAMNLGELPMNKANGERLQKSMATMETIERRLFPATAAVPTLAPRSPAAKPDATTPAPVRIGRAHRAPKVIRRVERNFAAPKAP
jgi:hypothetical protein